MAFREYLIGEVAEEFSEGLLGRREAVRRLGLLGLAVPGATALLAACGGGDDEDAVVPDADASGEASESPSESASESPSATPAVTLGPDAGELITFAAKDGAELKGAFKAADDPNGVLLVIHENKGLTTHFYDLVGRLAKAGFTSLCVDLVSRAGGTAKFSDPAEATAALMKPTISEQVGDLQSGIDELLKREKGAKVGAVGFCFGGGMIWHLLNAGEQRVLAAIPFYGPPGEDLDLTKSKAAVLAIYAGNDDRVNAYRDAVEKALKKAGLTHEIKTYDGVDHAFFNDTGQRYNATAAAAAERQMLGWFGKYLK